MKKMITILMLVALTVVATEKKSHAMDLLRYAPEHGFYAKQGFYKPNDYVITVQNQGRMVTAVYKKIIDIDTITTDQALSIVFSGAVSSGHLANIEGNAPVVSTFYFLKKGKTFKSLLITTGVKFRKANRLKIPWKKVIDDPHYFAFTMKEGKNSW